MYFIYFILFVVLNMAGCTSITRCIMELIPTKCTALTHLNISQIKIPCISITAIVSFIVVLYFIYWLFVYLFHFILLIILIWYEVSNLPQLIKVDLSFTKTNSATLSTLSKSCPNLEYPFMLLFLYFLFLWSLIFKKYCSFRGCETVSQIPKFGPNLKYLDASGSMVPLISIPSLLVC